MNWLIIFKIDLMIESREWWWKDSFLIIKFVISDAPEIGACILVKRDSKKQDVKVGDMISKF